MHKTLEFSTAVKHLILQLVNGALSLMVSALLAALQESVVLATKCLCSVAKVRMMHSIVWSAGMFKSVSGP